MEKENSSVLKLLSLAAIAGNIFFFLWVLHNGLNENFQGTMIEKISYITLMGLLAVNAFLLFRKTRK